MFKILILGLPASGKSTAAQKLSQAFKITHVEADKYFWNSEGLQENNKMFIEKIVQILNQNESWILEGHFKTLRSHIPKKMDSIILLDYPYPVVLYRWFKRSIKIFDFSDWRWLILKSRILRQNYEKAILDYADQGVKVMRIKNTATAIEDIISELKN